MEGRYERRKKEGWVRMEGRKNGKKKEGRKEGRWKGRKGEKGRNEGREGRQKEGQKEGRKAARPLSGVGLTHVCSPSALCWVAKRQFSHKSTACTLRGHSNVYHLLLPPERFSSPVCSAPHSAAG